MEIPIEVAGALKVLSRPHVRALTDRPGMFKATEVLRDLVAEYGRVTKRVLMDTIGEHAGLGRVRKNRVQAVKALGEALGWFADDGHGVKATRRKPAKVPEKGPTKDDIIMQMTVDALAPWGLARGTAEKMARLNWPLAQWWLEKKGPPGLMEALERGEDHPVKVNKDGTVFLPTGRCQKCQTIDHRAKGVTLFWTPEGCAHRCERGHVNAGWAYTWHHLSKKTGAKVIGPHNPVTRAKAVKSPPVVEDAPTPTPPVAVVEEAPPPPVVEDAPTPTPPVASTWDRIIFVGCLPVGTMVDLDLSTLLAPYQRRIEREGGKVNGREVSAVPYWNLLDYAQGPKRVAAALMADMFSGKAPTWRTLYVDPYDPCAGEVLGVLATVPKTLVVRATR